jgi:hypothetical protein
VLVGSLLIGKSKRSSDILLDNRLLIFCLLWDSIVDSKSLSVIILKFSNKLFKLLKLNGRQFAFVEEHISTFGDGFIHFVPVIHQLQMMLI